MSRMFQELRRISRFAVLAMGAVVALSAGAVSAPTTNYTGLVVFGDSLSDSGNVYGYSGGTVPISPPYFPGRFSNGPNYADMLALSLGLGQNPYGLTPSLGGGSNFAFGAANTGPAVLAVGGLVMPPIYRATEPGPGEHPSQLQMFYGAVGGAADPNALYVLWGGGNDLRDALLWAKDHPATALADGELVVSTAISNLQGSLVMLSQLGARHVLVPNLPDLGLTPESHEWNTNPAFPLPAYASALTGNFNVRLDAMLDSFQGSAFNLDIMPFDTHALFNDIVAHPADYGITDTTNACLSGGGSAIFVGGTVCSTPSEMVYWDNKHPSATVHGLLGQRMAVLVAVPEPQTLALWLTGLVWLGWRVRRQA